MSGKPGCSAVGLVPGSAGAVCSVGVASATFSAISSRDVFSESLNYTMSGDRIICDGGKTYARLVSASFSAGVSSFISCVASTSVAGVLLDKSFKYPIELSTNRRHTQSRSVYRSR